MGIALPTAALAAGEIRSLALRGFQLALLLDAVALAGLCELYVARSDEARALARWSGRILDCARRSRTVHLDYVLGNSRLPTARIGRLSTTWASKL